MYRSYDDWLTDDEIDPYANAEERERARQEDLARDLAEPEEEE